MEIRNGIIFFDTKAEFEAYVSDTNNVSITNYPVYIGDTKEIITHNVTYKDASEIDASQITSGKISIDRLPAGSLERCVVVANESARFALTTNDVQDGDTVKQSDTGVMYMVVDVNNLNSDAGYLTYTAVTDWESIANKPEFDYVKYSEQELTDEQKQIARENIGVPTKVSELENDKNYLESGSGDGTNLLADDGEYKAIKTVNGESLLGEGNIDVNHAIPVTYAELVELRNNGELIPGCTYLITNYKPVISSEASGKGFETYPASEYLYAIAVIANSNHTLSKQAKMLNQAGESYAIEYELDVNTVDHWWLKDSYPSHINGRPNSGVFLDRITTVDGKVLYLNRSSVQINALTYDIYISSDNFYALITGTALETGALMFRTNGSEITTNEYITIAAVEKVIIVNTGYTVSGGLTQVLAVRANAIVGSKADRLMWNDSTHEVSSVVANIEDITSVEHTDPNYSTGAVVWMRDENHNEARFDFKNIYQSNGFTREMLFESSQNCVITGPFDKYNHNWVKNSNNVLIDGGDANNIVNGNNITLRGSSSVILFNASNVTLDNCWSIMNSDWDYDTYGIVGKNSENIYFEGDVCYITLNNCFDCSFYGYVFNVSLDGCYGTSIDSTKRDYDHSIQIVNDYYSSFYEVGQLTTNNTIECNISNTYNTHIENCKYLTLDTYSDNWELVLHVENCDDAEITGTFYRSLNVKGLSQSFDLSTVPSNTENSSTVLTVAQDSNGEIQIYNEADLVNTGGGEHLIEVTYNELYDLKYSSQLIPGAKYCITDYECMLKSGTIKGKLGSRSMIVITAISNNQLSNDGILIPYQSKTRVNVSYYETGLSKEYIVIKAGNYEYFCKRFCSTDLDIPIVSMDGSAFLWESVTGKTIFATSTVNGTEGEIVTDLNGKTYTITVPAKTYYLWNDYQGNISGLSLNKDVVESDVIFKVRQSDLRIMQQVEVCETSEEQPVYNADNIYRIKYLFENEEALYPNLEGASLIHYVKTHCEWENGNEEIIYFMYNVDSFSSHKPCWNVWEDTLFIANESDEYVTELSVPYNLKAGEQYVLSSRDYDYTWPIGTVTILEDSQPLLQSNKGFIYEMEDIRGNQLPYDFVNSDIYDSESGSVSSNGILKYDGITNNKVIYNSLNDVDLPPISFESSNCQNNYIEPRNPYPIHFNYSSYNTITGSGDNITLSSSNFNVIQTNSNLELFYSHHNTIKASNNITVYNANNCQFNNNWNISSNSSYSLTDCYFGWNSNNITFNRSAYNVTINENVRNVIFNADARNVKVEVSDVTLESDMSKNKVIGHNSNNEVVVYNPADSSSDTILNSTF